MKLRDLSLQRVANGRGRAPALHGHVKRMTELSSTGSRLALSAHGAGVVCLVKVKDLHHSHRHGPECARRSWAGELQSPAEATAVLRSIGAELVADEAGELAAGLERVVALNTTVCRSYYNAIVHAAAAEVRLHSRLSLHIALKTCGARVG